MTLILAGKLPRAALLLRSSALVGLTAALLGCVAQIGYEGSAGDYDEPGYVEVQANEAPPPLPDYDQPPCPEDGYLWTPGFWSWAGGEYYWVPGTWVQPPQVGLLWTPGYWAFAGGGVYAFHAGYWGRHVGFYGGVNYGFGYTGHGFVGGAWEGNRYRYNNVNNSHSGGRTSYNGGAGGIAAAPSGQDRQIWRGSHISATSSQQQHTRQAAQDPALSVRANGGRPPIAATPRPAAFNAPGVVGARGAGPQYGGRPPQAETQPQLQGRGSFQNQQPNRGQGAQTPPTPPQPQLQPQPQYQGRGPGQNQQPGRGPGPQTTPLQPQPQPQPPPQYQGRGTFQNQPPGRGPAPQLPQTPASAAPQSQPPVARPPSPVQRPALIREPRHERDADRERPLPKKREDIDPASH